IGIPGQQRLRLGAPPDVGLRHGRAEPLFVALEARETGGPLRVAERRKREQVTVVAIALDLRRCQRLHAVLRQRDSCAADRGWQIDGSDTSPLLRIAPLRAYLTLGVTSSPKICIWSISSCTELAAK